MLLARYAETFELNFSKGQHYKPSFTEIQNFLTDIRDTSKEFQEKYPSLYAMNIIQGKDGRNVFDPAGKLTREAAVILQNTYDMLYER